MPLLTAEDYQKFPRVAPDFRYAYGKGAEQFGELTLPRTAPPHPVILLIHGGCYRALYDLQPLGTLAADLAAAGFAVWNIEYRRHGNGGAFPQMFLDVGLAADYLRQIAALHQLDLAQVISVGHSAGGHLALWLAGRPKIDRASPLFSAQPLPIRAVVALAPVADIERARAQGMCGEALLSVMGGEPAAAPAHYRAGSPRALLPLGLRQIHLVGSEDHAILDNVRGYIEAATQLGDAATLEVLPGVGHFELVTVGSAAWQEVRRALLQLRESL